MRNNHNNQGEEKDKEQAVEDPPMTHTTSQGMPHQNESKDTKERHLLHILTCVIHMLNMGV
jgi:hypothetical protein